jgi:hypothetical protein
LPLLLAAATAAGAAAAEVVIHTYDELTDWTNGAVAGR